MDTFLSCDWGTSTFRLRLVQTNDQIVRAIIQFPQGVAQTATAWQQTDGAISRQVYYTDFLNRQIHTLEQQLGHSLAGVPVVLSGMASSSIGLMELPYKELPFCIDGADLELRSVSNGRNPILLISGACTATDVMRGEETKIVGIADALPAGGQELLLLLPGTHPKHIQIRNGKAVSFQTFMTGEFFALLSRNSILSGSVTAGGDLTDPANRDCFINAVQQSRTTPLLHHAFRVRTNQLLKKMPPEQNYHYLSGLLIGEELSTVKTTVPVYLLGSAAHLPLYLQACEALGIQVTVLPDADEALITGQHKLLLKNKSEIVPIAQL